MIHEKLKYAFSLLITSHTFKPGDIVEWKNGLKNKRANGPFIVTEVLTSPVLSKPDDSGSCYYREPLDVKLAIIDDDDDFVEHHYDSRRFQPVAE